MAARMVAAVRARGRRYPGRRPPGPRGRRPPPYAAAHVAPDGPAATGGAIPAGLDPPRARPRPGRPAGVGRARGASGHRRRLPGRALAARGPAVAGAGRAGGGLLVGRLASLPAGPPAPDLAAGGRRRGLRPGAVRAVPRPRACAAWDAAVAGRPGP